ncbi:hypothetical protein VTK73DRAFT_9571 [Phialemonium thermophilum]|uniref:Uncharacterized protein n=1 Tax=Phialemonium thermophilum TaxID=223376 RepID=A0ABR3XKZ4_9PEZI
MLLADSLPTIKILVIGISGAGKSSLLKRYCDHEFDPDSATATIGVDIKTRALMVRGKPYRLNVFDTAGQERLRTLSTSFYRGAQGVILAYDISNRVSFQSLEKMFEEAEANTGPSAVLYLVGCKADRAEAEGGRAVRAEEGAELARAHGCVGFCELSAKTGENVRKPFVDLVDSVISSTLST